VKKSRSLGKGNGSYALFSAVLLAGISGLQQPELVAFWLFSFRFWLVF
jgi:hypothetical protein